MVYRGPLLTELVWVDRSGIRQAVAAPAGHYFSFSIAPDGRRVAAARLDPRLGTPDIWMFAPDEPAIRVTDNPDWDRDPVWSRDGTYHRLRVSAARPMAAVPPESDGDRT